MIGVGDEAANDGGDGGGQEEEEGNGGRRQGGRAEGEYTIICYFGMSLLIITTSIFLHLLVIISIRPSGQKNGV